MDTFTAVQELNKDLSRVSSWSEQCGLILNPIKSKLLIVGTKDQIDKVTRQDPQVMIGTQRLERVPVARNLGLLMDDQLRFEQHVRDIVKNCFYRLKVLYEVRKYLSVDIRIKLCDTLILSKLNYVDTVIHGRLLARSRALIQRVQNACVRFCFPVPPRSHVTPYLNDSSMLKMEARRSLHFAALLFGVVHNRQPHYLFQKLTFSSRPARGAIRLICPRHGRSAAFRGSFRYAATRCWNNIPPPIRNSKTLTTFKLKLRKYLLGLQAV